MFAVIGEAGVICRPYFTLYIQAPHLHTRVHILASNLLVKIRRKIKITQIIQWHGMESDGAQLEIVTCIIQFCLNTTANDKYTQTNTVTVTVTAIDICTYAFHFLRLCQFWAHKMTHFSSSLVK